MTLTLESVNAREERLHALRADLEAERTKLTELEQELAEAYLTGSDKAEELSQAASQSQAKIAAMENAIPRLEEQLCTDREAAYRAEGENRMVAISRAYGSRTARYQEDIDRVIRAAEEYAAAMQRLNRRYASIIKLRIEQLFLIDRFGLEASELAPVQAPVELEPVCAARAKTLENGPALLFNLPPRLLYLTPSDMEHIRAQIAESPAVELLGAAGDRPPGDSRTFRQRANDAQTQSRDREDLERRNAITRVDAWLRSQLSGGPVRRDDVLAVARNAGIPVSDGSEVSVMSARQRLKVIPVSRQDERGVAYWALTDHLPDGFTVNRAAIGTIPSSVVLG